MVTAMMAFMWMTLIRSCRGKDGVGDEPPRLTASMIPEMREHIIGKMYNMSDDIMKDVHVKHRIIERYIDMHKGTWDFEVGLIAGSLFEHFRTMLRTYRRFSNMSLMEYYDEWGWNVFYKKSQYSYFYIFQIVHGEYNEIVYNKRAFLKLLEKHKYTRNRFAGKTVQGVRRRGLMGGKTGDSDSKKSSKLKSDDYYVDLLGHRVDRTGGKKPKLLDEDPQHFEDYFQEHYEKLIETNHPAAAASMSTQTKEEHLRQAFEYMEKNSVEKMERELELHLNPKEREQINIKKKDFETIFKKQGAHVDSLSGNDEEYKKMLRLKSYEKQRAKFDPEREGINIDLTEMVK